MAVKKPEPKPQMIPSGDAARFLPAEFSLAAADFGSESLMRRMMRDPWLGLADAMIRALVTEGDIRIVPAIGDIEDDAPPKLQAEKALADTIAQFHEDWMKRLPRPMRRILWHAMEALPYGHKLCEIEWAVSGNNLIPVDIAPKPRGSYEFNLSNANRIESVKPMGSATDTLAPENVFVFSLAGRDDSPYGTPALERAYEAWYRKGCAKPLETKALAVFAGGIKWAEADKEAQTQTQTIDGSGNITTVPTSSVVATEAAKMNVGVTPSFPPGYRIEMVKPAESFGAFDSSYGRSDREMVAALLALPRSVLEAQFGSRADSETAEGLLSSIRDWVRGELCDAIRSQILMVATLANFGEAARDLCPTIAIVTEERGELGAITAAVRELSTAGILTAELADHLLSLVGVSESVRQSVMSSIENVADAANPEETQFRRPTPSKRQKDVADQAMLRIVKRYDKSLRRLVKRWTDGKIDAAEFELSFNDALQEGHESAAKLGVKLSGGAMSDDVREYLAATLADESEFLADLIDAVEAQEKTVSDARLAARRYAQRMSGTTAAAFHESSPAKSLFYWTLGGAEDHCPDCPRWASMSPFAKDELPTVPRANETTCRGACKCRLIRDDGACAPGEIADLGSYE